VLQVRRWLRASCGRTRRIRRLRNHRRAAHPGRLGMVSRCSEAHASLRARFSMAEAVRRSASRWCGRRAAIDEGPALHPRYRRSAHCRLMAHGVAPCSR
jgi:hypothetical protein